MEEQGKQEKEGEAEEEEGRENGAEEQSKKNVDAASSPPPPPPTYVLGYWSGNVLSTSQLAEQEKNRLESESASSAPHKTTRKVVRKVVKKKKAAPNSVRLFAPGSSEAPVYHLWMRNGETCWNVGPRQVDVKVHCGVQNRITDVRENGKCKYEFYFETPGACQKEHLAKMRNQLKAYEAWFNRPEPVSSEEEKQKALRAMHDEL
jgi:hypothetical protein